MAQIDIGKLKPTWKSAYNNSTAYVVDDMVSYQSQSYICKLASTGNVPTNTTYWDLIAAKGSDGTDADLAAISGTVQGDLYYNNGSAIARLAPGTSGQVLQTGGASANPSWGTVSSDWVKITSTTISSNAADVQIDNIFSATYKNYVIIGTNIKGDTQDSYMRFRFLNGSGAQLSGSHYRGASFGGENNSGSGNNSQHSSAGSDSDIAGIQPAGNVVDNVRGGFNFVMNIPDPFPNASTSCYGTYGCIRNNGNSLGGTFHVYYNSNTATRGVKFDYASGI